MSEPTDPRGSIQDQIDASAAAQIIPGLTNILAVNKYKLLRDADDATGGFLDGTYLARHQRERDYFERRNFSAYQNYVKPILSARVNPVFQRPPQRGPMDDVRWDEFLKDCDGRRTPMTAFMKRAARLAMRDKVVFVIMDADATQPESLGEALRLRSFPYLYIRTAESVHAYEVDKFGNLESVTFTEWIDVGGEETRCYKRWSADGWTVYKKSERGVLSEVLDAGDGPGFMPVIAFYGGEREAEDVLPMPDFYSIARCNLVIYNISSEIRELQRGQGFSLLTYPAKKIATGIIVGLKNLLTFDPAGSHAPAYISPDSSIQANFESERNSYVLEIYRMAELLGVMGKSNAAAGATTPAQSGVAKEWDFRATNTVLADLAERCEVMEQQIAVMFGDYVSFPAVDYTVRYTREFGIVDVMDEISRADAALLLRIGGTFDVAVKERLAHVMFPEKSPEELALILEEIMAGQMDTDAANAAARGAPAPEPTPAPATA